MTVNLGNIDRLLRLIVGIVLLGAPFTTSAAIFETNTAIILSVILGVIMVATSAMKFCPLYRIFGIRACKL